MVTTAETTDLRAPHLPAEENDLSRRYGRMLERWIPVGLEYFAPWPERPNCGHFLGGVHWYGQETAEPALAFALASTSPEYDERATGVSRDELRRMAIQGVRYLCFTHDTGPAECVRPSVGRGRPENCGTKWGERGKGFFRESQCGRTTATLALIALLLRAHVDDETWLMVARIQEDYLERFGDLPPRSGVYWDTQMEENAWTAHGLAGALLFLERHERAPAWEAMARRWMFSTCAAPPDAQDRGMVGQTPVRSLVARTYTTLPDYWAENHGMVHPTYTASGVRSLMTVGSLYRLWGRELPPELFWNRRRVYERLKALTDGGGYPQAVQGMDWHYLPATGSDAPHAIASVFFHDPEAAALQRLALRNAERRQEGNGGRLYDRELAARAHDQQDPMVMRELTIGSAAALYLLHRLFGPGAEPVPLDELERRLAGVRVFPHAGFVHHRHGRGQTSLSWRNSIMALPLPREGTYTISPASDSWLGTPEVADKPDSHRLQRVQVSEYEAGFTAVLVVDRCQESLRQQVLFASLPDGRALSFERFIALEDLTVTQLAQGFLRLTNERFPLLGPNSRGARMFFTPGGSKEYRGWLGTSESEDVIDRYDHPAWVNVDDRLGIRFQGTGQTVYHNRHWFRPYRAVADDLILSRLPAPRAVRAGEEAAHLAALLCPELGHEATAQTVLALATDTATADAVCLLTDGYAAAASFGARARRCVFAFPRPEAIPVYPGATVEAIGATLRLAIHLQGGSAALLAAERVLQAAGDVRVEAVEGGGVYVTNVGSGAVEVAITGGEGPAERRLIGRGQTVAC